MTSWRQECRIGIPRSSGAQTIQWRFRKMGSAAVATTRATRDGFIPSTISSLKSNMGNSKLYFAVLFAVATAAPLVQADEFLDADLRPLGAPDTSLCGFDVNRTPVSLILNKMGEPTTRTAAPEEPRHVTYSWTKGPLNIRISTYTLPGYESKPPASIEVEGSDPGKVCATGRGIALGDSVDYALKLYGKNHDTFPYSGDEAYNFKWPRAVNVLLSLTKDKNAHIKRITLSGKLL
jgi:hypothetical protein